MTEKYKSERKEILSRALVIYIGKGIFWKGTSGSSRNSRTKAHGRRSAQEHCDGAKNGFLGFLEFLRESRHFLRNTGSRLDLGYIKRILENSGVLKSRNEVTTADAREKAKDRGKESNALLQLSPTHKIQRPR